MALMGAIGKLIEVRKATPGGDLVDLIMAGATFEPGSGKDESEGRALEDHEVIRMIAIILFGAIDTTSLAITGTLYYLANPPRGAGHAARALASRRPRSRRWSGGTARSRGWAARSPRDKPSSAACPLKEGDKVMLVWASGIAARMTSSRTPTRWTSTGDRTRHLGFGHGPHKCVGAEPSGS